VLEGANGIRVNYFWVYCTRRGCLLGDKWSRSQ